LILEHSRCFNINMNNLDKFLYTRDQIGRHAVKTGIQQMPRGTKRKGSHIFNLGEWGKKRRMNAQGTDECRRYYHSVLSHPTVACAFAKLMSQKVTSHDSRRKWISATLLSISPFYRSLLTHYYFKYFYLQQVSSIQNTSCYHLSQLRYFYLQQVMGPIAAC